MPRRIILDCDPGHDDAIALFLAAGSPEIELAAITTVAGNASVGRTTANALAVAAVAGLTGVPIARGAHRPLVGAGSTAPSIHGESGLDGPRLPSPTTELDARHAVQLIVDLVMASEPGEITLVPIGPLTNIALAARLEPRIVPRVREVVLMGGAYATGNWSAAAEFNIAVDPEAAHVVFGEPWPVTMVGLDLTHQALATRAVRERIAAVDSAAARFTGELLDFYGSAYDSAQGFAAPPVHDPCAVAYVIDPGVMTTRRAPLDVELRGGLTRGMTVVDVRGYGDDAGDGERMQHGVTLDAERFWDLVVDALGRLPVGAGDDDRPDDDPPAPGRPGPRQPA